MTILLLLALLQAPDDLPGFLAALEKDRAAGVAVGDLVKRIDEWSKKRTPDALARLAWNRELLLATEWANGLRLAWLTKKVGERATLGKFAGVVREVKADRVVLQGDGGPTEVLFASLAPEDGLAEMKADKIIEAPTPDEAILCFAGGKADVGLAQARAFEAVLLKGRALGAFVGWALQAADRHVAEGKPVRAAEFLAASWTRHEDLMEAGEGALHRFVHQDLLPRLFDELDELVAKNRKEARRVLDLVPALSKSKEVLGKAHARRFAMLESNQWHPLRLEDLNIRGDGEFKDGVIAWKEEVKGVETSSTLIPSDLPFSWELVSGVRAKLRPSADYFDMRLGFGDPAKYHIVAVLPKDAKILCAFVEARGAKMVPDTRAKTTTKPEYVLRIERGKDFWKIYVDAQEVKLFKTDANPTDLLLVVADGKCELVSLEFRRK